MASKKSALKARLGQLGISETELAVIVRRPVDVIQNWVANGPDEAGKVLLRVLDDDHVATLAVQKVRATHKRTLRGDAMDRDDISVEAPAPVLTGGVPS